MTVHEETAKNDGNRPKIIVVGNEKGGTGKSTTAIHLAIGLLHRGLKVGTLDLDPRQGTMTRYLQNRERYTRSGPALCLPRHHQLDDTTTAVLEDAEASAKQRIGDVLVSLADHDVVIIDTPGNASTISRMGHEEADILITPVNDSLVDIDVLAEIDPVNRTVVAPSFYCRMAWEYHNRRIVEGRSPIDWIVIRNRLPHVHSNNHRDIDDLLAKLSQRIGFRVVGGLSERVVFRELFLKGLTVLDLPAIEPGWRESSSQRAARLEIDSLLDALRMPLKHSGTATTAVSA
jgi:chromosome partitioning protein